MEEGRERFLFHRLAHRFDAQQDAERHQRGMRPVQQAHLDGAVRRRVSHNFDVERRLAFYPPEISSSKLGSASMIQLW